LFKPAQAQRVVGRVAQIVSAAHRATPRLVHRDLKPSNILVERRQDSKIVLRVTDFGIGGLAAQPVLERSRSSSLQENMASVLTGAYSPLYASPQQMRGERPDPRDDVYALGVIWYQLLTSDFTSPAPTGGRWVDGLRRQGMSHGAIDLLSSCFESDPAHRPDDAGMLADLLQRLSHTAPAKPADAGTELPLAKAAAPVSLKPSSPPAAGPQPAGLPKLDEIQFTIYRPKTVCPGLWYPMLAFAHLAERRPEASEDEQDPIEQVRAQVEQVLGEQQLKQYRDTTVDARQGVPREGEITLLPDVPGVEFNPRLRVFRWLEDVHREEFRMRSAHALDGTTARGRLSVYLGAILLAEVDLAVKVDSRMREVKQPKPREPLEANTCRPFRRIFASYSHKDVVIVRQYERFVESLGDRYLRDVRDLRAGENWDEALLRLIDQAEVFQLFWSRNAMASPFVRREWEYALGLNRAAFVRPTYWENPLPEVPEQGLPPEALRRLHFHQIRADEPRPAYPLTQAEELVNEAVAQGRVLSGLPEAACEPKLAPSSTDTISIGPLAEAPSSVPLKPSSPHGCGAGWSAGPDLRPSSVPLKPSSPHGEISAEGSTSRRAAGSWDKPSSPHGEISAESIPTPAQRRPPPPLRTESKPASPAPRVQRQEAAAILAHLKRSVGWFTSSRRWVAAGLLGIAGLLGVILGMPAHSPPSGGGPPVNAPPIPESSAKAPESSDAEYLATRVGQIKLKRIAAGTFPMGSLGGDTDAVDDERPQHRVRVTRPFYLGVYEINQAQYQAVMGNNPSWFSSNGSGKDKIAGQSTDRHPVESVSWLDAVKFCNKLSEMEGLKPFYEINGETVRVLDWTGPGYRLPTEAEWEYACRANEPTPQRYSFGDNAGSLGEFAWYSENSGNATHPVGEKRPSGFGLFDMHGNVWEWCWDCYSDAYYKEPTADDPRGPSGASHRVLRGGGWINEPRGCRSAARYRYAPGERLYDLSFRLALGQSGR